MRNFSPVIISWLVDGALGISLSCQKKHKTKMITRAVGSGLVTLMRKGRVTLFSCEIWTYHGKKLHKLKDARYFLPFPTAKKNNTINTVPYMDFCVSSISTWWFVWRFCYIRNVLLFTTHLMHVPGIQFKKIKNLFMVSARCCEIYFILQVLLYTFNDAFKCNF